MKDKDKRKKYISEKLISKKVYKKETEKEKKERLAKIGKAYWEKLT